MKIADKLNECITNLKVFSIWPQYISKIKKKQS